MEEIRSSFERFRVYGNSSQIVQFILNQEVSKSGFKGYQVLLVVKMFWEKLDLSLMGQKYLSSLEVHHGSSSSKSGTFVGEINLN